MRIGKWAVGNIVVPCDINYDGVDRRRVAGADKVLHNVVTQQSDEGWRDYWLLLFVDQCNEFDYVTRASNPDLIKYGLERTVDSGYPSILFVYDSFDRQFYRIILDK